MGNQCCCEDDPSGKPLDANVLVWRPETQPGPLGKSCKVCLDLGVAQNLEARVVSLCFHLPPLA